MSLTSSGNAGGEGTSPLLEVSDLKCHFAQRRHLAARRRVIRAVDGVSFEIQAGETLALIGESGCGKSTVARLVLALVPLTSGQIRLEGQVICGVDGRRRKTLSRSVQMIFQNPLDALDPRIRVFDQIAEPLHIHDIAEFGDRADKVARLAAELGLDEKLLSRYPHELSGGQLQRVVIARALILEPRLVVCDEPVSALDVSIQAQTINLLKRLQDTMGLAYLFITHDLRTIRHIATRIAVMYLGRLVEEGPTAAILAAPKHPYTRALLNAVPRLSGRRMVRDRHLRGEPPSASDPPSGCHFHPRCPLAMPICQMEAPELTRSDPYHRVACHAAGHDVDKSAPSCSGPVVVGSGG